MKSCLSILIVFFTFVAVIGGGVFLWYISSSSEFSRTSTNPPKAIIVAPKATPIR